MAFTVELAEGERVEQNIHFLIKKELFFQMVLTNKGAYWPGRKKFAVSDPIYTEFAPLSKIVDVVVQPKSLRFGLMAGLLMFIIGMAWGAAGLFLIYDARNIVYPLILILSGIVYPLLVGRKRVIRIVGVDKKFSWTSPVMFGKSKKDMIEASENIKAWALEHRLIRPKFE
ncbi:hypothetical protein Dalk_2972 [Desulfatibacillum aliphaticivorans]|uniref:Uncharacterized protein n=1 Tax=Desulfatibacillum aliphaticivorans TaxID=218208 RepID=B8FL27_DESAL|nr:hypothetical protein [Desulfatibacillum aliphaticivorans]ACL04662.1 hypothetical protein Dalk_2972 [Desulfatibacillum aliphaticivorans]